MSRRTLPVGVSTVVFALLATSGAATSASTATPDARRETHPEWGKTSAPNQVLKKGCHNYRYNYKLTPPEGDWALETFLVGPGGKRLASGAFAGAFDPEKGPGTFRICKATTRYGRFKIKAKLSVQNGPTEYTEGWLPKSHFRLRRPSH